MEILTPTRLREGFQAIGSRATRPTLQPVTEKPRFLTSFFPRRGDLGGPLEEKGYKMDPRYFNGWADVQGIGAKNDYCRVVYPEGSNESESFFACGMAGTEGLSSVTFRTKAVHQGFKLGRDDYMKAYLADGKEGYCRIVRQKDGTFQPMCVIPRIDRFSDQEFLDADPPEDVKTLVDFYRGAQIWFRFADDMKDYAQTSTVQTVGAASVQEWPPRPIVTRGLSLNGRDQYLRIGDSTDLSLGNRGSLRSVRAWSVWVRFDEFTNNAHVFDFGDGPGRNNTFLGILGRGDSDLATDASVRAGPICQESTVPAYEEPAKFTPECTPQELMETTRANIDEYKCIGPEVVANPRRAQPIQTRPVVPLGTGGNRATLLYEVWDSRLRKMQIKLNRVIPKGRWVHIAITAKNMDAMRPDILVYINGNSYYTQESGFLPQAATTTHNYIGKSNWTDLDTGYELRDELFAGSIYDFRMYNQPLSETKVKRILAWGMPQLGLDSSYLTAA